MIASVPKESLSHMLHLTSTIAERKSSMPILANVKILAEGDGLTISATDLEISLSGRIPCQVKTPGSITIDAKVLFDVVRDLPGESVMLKLGQAQRLEIESGPSRFKINGTSAEEFPSISGLVLDNPVSVDAQKISQMFDKTAFAVSTDETRYSINGVYVELLEDHFGKGKSGLRFVATDGHRLAMIDRPADGFELEKGVIIPRKGIQEIRRVLEGNEGVARVGLHEGFFTIEAGDVTIGVRLVDGDFPDYRQVVPVEHGTTASMGRLDFLAAVKRVSVVSTDKARAIKLKLVSGNLICSSSSAEYGEASESLEVEQDGDDVSIGFSARYLIDALSAMPESRQVELRLNGDLGPGLLVGEETEHYSCIVMPMRFE